MSHVTARLLAVVVLLCVPATAVAATTPGHEHTGIVNLSGKSGSSQSTAAAPVASASAPAAAAPRVTGTDGLPYTGGSPLLGAAAGIGFLMLGLGLRLRYGSPFRAYA
jgi:hypothetical protein